MATHHGKNGTAKVGSDTIAEIDAFTLREQIATSDDSAMGDDYATHLTGLKSWNGTVTCHWDETDTNGQETMVVGASVALKLYPEGAATGAAYYYGTATITEVGTDVNKGSIVQRTFNFTGNGALTKATAA